MSEGEKYNSLCPYEPFQWSERKVRLEGEGVEGADFQAVLDGLARALDLPESVPRRDSMIDFYLYRISTMMLSTLAARAANGKKSAAAFLDKAIREALDDHRILLMRKNPVIVQRVQDSPQMPGWVSTHKPLMEDELCFAERNEQGKNYPFPPPASDRGRSPSILTAQHLLVDHLYNFMVSSRYDYLSDELFFEEEFGEVHPMTKRLRALPFPISSGNWKEWYELGVEVLNDATNGHPETHEMFRAKPFSAMNSRKLKDRLREAFEAKGKALDRIAEQEPVE